MLSRSVLLTFLLPLLLISCADAGRENLPVREPSEVEQPENRETRAERGTQDEIPFVAQDAELCTFGRRRSPVEMIYRGRDGLEVSGEMPGQTTARFRSSVPSALARPKDSSYRAVVDRDCHDAQRNVYYSCPEVKEVDLSQVRGIARAETIELAERLAIRACRHRAQELVASEIEVRQDSQSMNCEIVERAFCPAPASTGAGN